MRGGVVEGGMGKEVLLGDGNLENGGRSFVG